MAQRVTRVACVVLASLGIVCAMAVEDGDAEGSQVQAESERNNPSSFVQRLADNYQEYLSNGKYEQKRGDETRSGTSSQTAPSKRRLSWEALHSNPDGEMMGFWKRFKPSKDSAFWKRGIGSEADDQLRGFWKRNSFSDSNKNAAFWKRSGQAAVPEDDQVSAKRAFVPLPVIIHPKYRNVLPITKMAAPFQNDPSLDWLIRTLTSQGRMAQGQRPDLPLPPKDRRQEPKLNPDFNPTGW